MAGRVTDIFMFCRHYTLAEFILRRHNFCVEGRGVSGGPDLLLEQWVHYPWRLSLCLLSLGHSSILALPIKLVICNRGLFKGLTREANVSGNSFHGDLSHSKRISLLNLTWLETFLEYKITPRGMLDLWLGDRASLALEVKFVNWARINYEAGGWCLLFYAGVSLPIFSSFCILMSSSLICVQLKSLGDVNW